MMEYRPHISRCPAPPADGDELSAGNAGFEATDWSSLESKAEYCRGWRRGVGHGLVGGGILGAWITLTLVWLGVRSWAQVL